MFAVPAFFAAAVHQLLVPGLDRPVEERLPAWLRLVLGLQALVMLAWGILLFARPDDAGSVWAWPLAPLAAEATAAWLLGIGGSAAYIALRGDRADIPGAALSYIVLGTIWIGGAIFAGDAFHNGLDGRALRRVRRQRGRGRCSRSGAQPSRRPLPDGVGEGLVKQRLDGQRGRHGQHEIGATGE